MKVSELEGVELDYWTVKAAGWEDVKVKEGVMGRSLIEGVNSNEERTLLAPSIAWAHIGPLIEEQEVCLNTATRKPSPGDWCASHPNLARASDQWGRTPLEAACRAIVASVYGDTVPEEAE